VNQSLAMRISGTVVTLNEVVGRVDAMTIVETGEFYDKAHHLGRMVDEFVAFSDEAVLQYVLSGREPVVNRGGVWHRLFAKNDSSTRCNNYVETARYILETAGPEALIECMTSQPFKLEACRKYLGDEFHNHFTRIERNKLAEGGAPKKRLTVARNAEEIVDE
jgi:hypothetical protein